MVSLGVMLPSALSNAALCQCLIKKFHYSVSKGTILQQDLHQHHQFGELQTVLAYSGIA
jgi:hypothetical protein